MCGGPHGVLLPVPALSRVLSAGGDRGLGGEPGETAQVPWERRLRAWLLPRADSAQGCGVQALHARL